jgi:hypothetical protein
LDCQGRKRRVPLTQKLKLNHELIGWTLGNFETWIEVCPDGHQLKAAQARVMHRYPIRGFTSTRTRTRGSGCGYGWSPKPSGEGTGRGISLPEVLPDYAIIRTGFCTVYVTTVLNGVVEHEKVLITCELTQIIPAAGTSTTSTGTRTPHGSWTGSTVHDYGTMHKLCQNLIKCPVRYSTTGTALPVAQKRIRRPTTASNLTTDN